MNQAKRQKPRIQIWNVIGGKIPTSWASFYLSANY